MNLYAALYVITVEQTIDIAGAMLKSFYKRGLIKLLVQIGVFVPII